VARVESERCTWCGAPVGPEDGYRAEEAAGARRAVFCRLEHVVPWGLQGAHWEPGSPTEPAAVAESLERCSHCGEALPDVGIVFVHHRGEHRVADGFCRPDHLVEWAKAGGRWR
jgi:hypothetical protein